MSANPRFPADDNSLFCAQPNALSESERLLAAYFSSSTMGLAIVDAGLRYVALNRALADINGIPAQDHLGKTLREVLGSFADRLEPAFKRVLTDREPMTLEISSNGSTGGEPRSWVKHYIPIRDDSGVVRRIAVVVVETTERRKQQASLLESVAGKLRQEMDRLHMLLDVSGIMSANLNLSEVFPQISARIRRILHHEYAGYELHDPATGLLIRQAQDFPLGKGLLSAVPISPNNSPGGMALRQRSPLIFSRDEMSSFQSDITRSFIDEGLRSLCCVPLTRPKGDLGVLVLGSTRDSAFRPEDLDLLNQVAEQFAVALENHRAAAEIAVLKERLAEEKKHLEGEIRSAHNFSEIIGDSPAIHQVLEQVATVAPSDATVLILGETGTGKELVARAIHRLGRRREGSFIKVNCAAIPTGLLESELFGHEKGAFTGALSLKVGRMELAHGGTLFLDEIGEISLELQPKLLRVLQDQEFERLGGNRTIKVDLRLIAATNRDLAQSMADKEFRSDLFYRLSVFPIRVPPLRERPQDIPLLIRYFVRKFAQRMDRPIESIPKETIAALTNWPWPGNVRELENLMERSVILSTGKTLHVPLSELRPAPGGGVHRTAPQIPADVSLDVAEREHIIRTLRSTGGILSGVNGAASRLGLKRTTLQSKMHRLKITRKDYLP